MGIIRTPTAIAILVAGVAAIATTAGAKPWPTNYNAPRASWTEGVSPDGYTYRTNFYRIVSKVELGEGRIGEMATTAEGVRETLELFPLRLLPEGPPRGDLHVVRIFATHDDYRDAGGPEGSVGYYHARSREVMVSMERLIEPKGPRSNLEPRQRYRLLVHELVHQAMGERIEGLPVWMAEGFAEYFAACQFAPGRYRFDRDARAIIDHLKAQWLGPSRRAITVPKISTTIAMSSGAWAADNRKSPETAYAKYAGSLLLTHYQLELARLGRGALASFLEAEPDFEAVPGFRGRYRQINPSQAPLWKGRPPQNVERALTAYWSKRGLDVSFSNTIKRDRPPFP